MRLFLASRPRVRTDASMTLSLARRRVVLRAIVLVQLALVALVAWSVQELVAFDSQVPPGMVFVTTAMLGCTVVALRATFRRSSGQRGHRFAFMSAEALCVMLPVAAELFYGVLRRPPADTASSGLVELLLGLELLAAGCVAAVATLLAPYLLAPVPESREDSPYERALFVWSAVAVVATLAIGGVYKSRYDETHAPGFLLQQLFTVESPVHQRQLAARLVDARVTDDPKMRETLFNFAVNGPVYEQTWAAYLLIATGRDDGRAIDGLRKLIGGYATLRAVDTLAMLGNKSAPAMADLESVMRKRTSDELIAAIQSRAADALAQIGPPAIAAVPALVNKLGEKSFWELRLSAAAAVDRIDPGYAARCVTGFPTVLDALTTEQADVVLNPECKSGTGTD
jgi:hypothetical protein